MAEQIISGSGTQYPVAVDITNRMYVVGSITHMPTVSVAAGSESYLFAKSGAEYFPLTCVSGLDGGTLNVAGTFSATTGSESYIKGGSITLYGVGSVYLAGGLGSVYIAGGSITSMPSVSVTTGSESYIKGGSISVYNQVAGSIVYMPSISTGSESWIKGGSIEVYNLYAGSKVWQGETLGVSGLVDTGLYAGSKLWQGERYGISGIVDITTRIAGSIVNMPIVGISGTNFSEMIGSVRAQSVQITNPWQIAGSIWSMPSVGGYAGSESWIKGGSIQTYAPLGSNYIMGSVYVVGSINQTKTWDVSGIVNIGNQYLGSETWIKAGSIQTYNPLGSTFVLGSVYVTGSINIATNLASVGSYTGMSNGSIWWGGGVGSMVISGTSIPVWKGIGSVLLEGIGSVFNVDVLADLGSPSFKRGILTASGTYTDVWAIGGAGSRVEMHGYHISTNAPGYIRLCRSGTTPVVIIDWNLNFASGATIEKTFATPMIPNAANTPIGIGATVAGSTLCTIFGREVK